jgi:hypothetical protein
MTIAFTNNNVIQPIETMYRGYRFRSRLEARWAVFFDAAGIEWEYEPDGYVVDGRRYLPDFWLPELKTLVETKPHIEACEEVLGTIKALVSGTGQRGLLIAGTPKTDEAPKLTAVLLGSFNNSSRVWQRRTEWQQCHFCDRVFIREDECSCTKKIEVNKSPYIEGAGPRVEHAMAEAQRARFEHGEDGRPRPYSIEESPWQTDVYIAGSVIEDLTDEMPDGTPWTEPGVAAWRCKLFGRKP